MKEKEKERKKEMINEWKNMKEEVGKIVWWSRAIGSRSTSWIFFRMPPMFDGSIVERTKMSSATSISLQYGGKGSFCASTTSNRHSDESNTGLARISSTARFEMSNPKISNSWSGGTCSNSFALVSTGCFWRHWLASTKSACSSSHSSSWAHISDWSSSVTLGCWAGWDLSCCRAASSDFPAASMTFLFDISMSGSNMCPTPHPTSRTRMGVWRWDVRCIGMRRGTCNGVRG